MSVAPNHSITRFRSKWKSDLIQQRVLESMCILTRSIGKGNGTIAPIFGFQ